METRRSIRRPMSVSGRGLHTGSPVTLVFHPAKPGTGITFRRDDLPSTPIIHARSESVRHTERRTALGAGDATVETVEHVLAAAAAQGIDDLTIALDGPDTPNVDGSAAPFFDALTAAEVIDVGGHPRRLVPLAPLTVQHDDATYEVAPAAALSLSVTIEWAHPLIGRQSLDCTVSPGAFGRELAAARTFGFAHEVDGLRSRGLIQGADASSAVILTEQGVLNPPLHWPDEFVRHKSVDLLGDLALLGGRLAARGTAHRPSHAGNVALVRALQQTTPTGSLMAIGIGDILKALPHRYPMLLVDRILEVQGTKRIVGIKNVTINEPFFQGHFPGHPVMPGVLIVEAMAQVGGMLLMSTIEKPEDTVVYFMSIDGVKFRRPVIPGDQIRFEVETVQVRGKTVKMKGVGLVEGQVAAEAEFMAQIVQK